MRRRLFCARTVPVGTKVQAFPLLPISVREIVFCALWLGTAAGLLGCTSSARNVPFSSIDADYLRGAPGAASSGSAGVSFYQRVLGLTLGSHCRWEPSDSAYAQLTHRQCGSLKGVFKSSARFLLEYDAAYLGYPALVRNSGAHFRDSANDCSWY